MTFTYHRPRNRKKLTDWKSANVNAIHSVIKTLPTIKEKQELVGKHNAYLFIFGRGLSPKNPYEVE